MRLATQDGERDGHWMRLAQVAQASQQIAATSARREKIAILAACLAQLVGDEVAIGVAFLSGELRQGRIGVGHSTLQSLRVPPARSTSLALGEVDAVFERVAAIQGAGAGAERQRLLAGLWARCDAFEQDFLRRLLLGALRQGALEGLMADALARAYAVPASTIRRAVMLTGDVQRVAHLAHEQGKAGLDGLKLRLFRPVAPMLAQSVADPASAILQLDAAYLEWKLDGARVQLHRDGGDLRVYSRQLNDVTTAVPELVALAQQLPARAFVLDGEALAIDTNARPLPFQSTMRRFGRRIDVDRLRATLPLTPFYFDVLHLDGEDLLDRPLWERKQALDALLPAANRVPSHAGHEASEADAWLAAAITAGHEGLVAKALDSPYEAGRRGGSWLKIKRAHTVDLVVLAAEWGSGRREGLLSNLHLGARAGDGGFVMLGKTFKGMTDEMLAWQTQHLLDLEVARDAYTVYVRPELVVEIAFDGLQQSSRYPGGVALRFARVKRYRTDKRVEEADSFETVRATSAVVTGAPP